MEFPNPYQVIDQRLSNIEVLLLSLKHHPAPVTVQEPEELLDPEEVAAFLKYKTVQTVYDKYGRGELPLHKQGNRLYGVKSELINWVKSGGKPTNEQIRAAASEHIATPLKPGRKPGKQQSIERTGGRQSA